MDKRQFLLSRQTEQQKQTRPASKKIPIRKPHGISNKQFTKMNQINSTVTRQGTNEEIFHFEQEHETQKVVEAELRDDSEPENWETKTPRQKKTKLPLATFDIEEAVVKTKLVQQRREAVAKVNDEVSKQIYLTTSRTTTDAVKQIQIENLIRKMTPEIIVADEDDLVRFTYPLRKHMSSNKAMRMIQSVWDTAYNIISTEYAGLNFQFKKFETPEEPRDTSTKICYTSKTAVPSRTKGFTDPRTKKTQYTTNGFRQKMTKTNEHKPEPTEPLKSNPLPAFEKKRQHKLLKNIQHTIESHAITSGKETQNRRFWVSDSEDEGEHEATDIEWYTDDEEELVDWDRKCAIDNENYRIEQASKEDTVLETNSALGAQPAPHIAPPLYQEPIPTPAKNWTQADLAQSPATIPSFQLAVMHQHFFAIEGERKRFEKTLRPEHRGSDYYIFYLNRLYRHHIDDIYQAVYNCEQHKDKLDTCSECGIAPQKIEIKAFTKSAYNNLLYSKRKGLHMRNVLRTQSMINSLIDTIKTKITSMVTSLIDKLGKSIATEAISTISHAAKNTTLAAALAVRDNTCGLLLLATIIYDLMTDLRPISAPLIGVYMAKFAALGICGYQFLKCLKAYFFQDDPYEEPEDDAWHYEPEVPEPNVTTSGSGEQPTKINLESGEEFLFTQILSFITKFLPFDATLLRKLQLFNNLGSAVKTISNLFLWIVTLLPDCIRKYFSTPDKMLWEKIVEDEEGLWKVFIVLSGYLAGCKTNRKSVDKQMLMQWRTVSSKLHQFIHDPKYGATADQKRTYIQCVKDVGNMEASQAVRDMEPIWFYIYGESKIGKSACVPLLSAIIQGLTLAEAEKTSYYYNCDSDYLDGYNEEKVVFITDDIGAINRPQAPHKDYLIFINAVSPAPFMVPMSTVDDPTVGKKGTYFTSDVIITLSNIKLKEDGIPELAYPEALFNRMHHLVMAKQREELKMINGQPTLVKVPVDLKHYSHLDFHLNAQGTKKTYKDNLLCDDACKTTHEYHQFATGDILCPKMRATKAVMSFYEFARYCRLQYLMKKKFSQMKREADDNVEIYRMYESKFEGNDDLFIDAYARARDFTSKEVAKIKNEYRPEPFHDVVEPKDGTHLKTNGAEAYLSADTTNILFQSACMLSSSVLMNLMAVGAWTCYRGLKLLHQRPWMKHLFDFLDFVQVGFSLVGTYYGIKGFVDLVRFAATADEEIAAQRIEDFNNYNEIQTQSFVPGPRSAVKQQTGVVSALRTNGAEMEPDMNAVLITVQFEGQIPFTQNAYMTHGFNMLTTKHMFVRKNTRGENENFNMTLAYWRHGEEFSGTSSFKYTDIIHHPKKDLVEISVERMNVMPFRDRRNLFLKEGESVPNVFDGEMQVYSMTKTPLFFQVPFVARTEERTMQDISDGQAYLLTTGYSAYLSSTDGYCGSVVRDSSNRILAMHVATAPTMKGTLAMSVAICREDITLDNGVIFPPIKCNGKHAWGEVIISPSVVPEGRLEKADMHFQPTDTQIRESLLHDQIRTHITEPSVLSTSDKRSNNPEGPLLFGARKYLDQPLELDQGSLEYGEQVFDFYFNQHDTGIQPGLLSVDQVLNGDPNIPHVKGIDLKTSTGHGYKSKGRGKEGYIGLVDGRYKIIDQTLQERVDTLWDQLDNNIVPQVVVDTLKDERRKISKIAAGDTRVFNVHSQEYTIVMLRLFGKAIAHFMELSKKDSPFAVGIDPYSKQWDQKVRYMLEVGEWGFDGDGVKFDANFALRSLILNLVKVLSKWTTQYMDKETAKKYMRKMRNAALSGETILHLLAAFAFWTGRGTLSGNILTTLFNSGVILQLLYIGYLHSAPVGMKNLASFHKHVRTLIFGDDHIVTVSSVMRPHYGYQQQKQYFDQIRMKYTPGSKTDNEQRNHWNFKEMTFLKNHTGRLGNFYVALLDNDVIWEMINWITKCDDPTAALITNIKTAQRYWYFYGPDHFKVCMSKIKKYVKEPLFTYQELDDIYQYYGGWEDTYSPYRDCMTNIELAQQL
jgi:hypothetical protein